MAEHLGKLQAGNILVLCFPAHLSSFPGEDGFLIIINIRFWHLADFTHLLFHTRLVRFTGNGPDAICWTQWIICYLNEASHFSPFLTIVFKMVMSLRMQATSASFLGLPTVSSR